MNPFNLTRLEGDIGLVSIERYSDHRGWLAEIFNQEAFSNLGLPVFTQDNISRTLQRGTVRGLHFQAPPASQAKLFRVVRGSAFNVVVNLAATGPERLHARFMNDEAAEWLFIPPGHAHGFQALEDHTEVHVKVTNKQDKRAERCVAFDDPELAISWPLPCPTELLSNRDRAGRPVSEFCGLFVA